MSKPKLVAAVAALAAIVAGSAAYASIPDGNGVIHGCYGKPGSARPGLVRVIDSPSQSCAAMENPLNWNQPGARGQTGPKGDKGDTGDPGLPGAASTPAVYVRNAQNVDLPADKNKKALVAWLDLPAGNYLVSFEGESDTFDTETARCELYQNGLQGTLLDQTGAESDNATQTAVAVTDVIGSASPFEVDFYCDSAGVDFNRMDGALTATAVAAVHSQ